MPYDPKCNQIEYTLSLFYYKNQKYDGSDLDKIEPTKIEKPFVQILKKSVDLDKLIDQNIMQGRNFTDFSKTIMKKLSKSVKYNMLVFDMNDIEIKNKTYLL